MGNPRTRGRTVSWCIGSSLNILRDAGMITNPVEIVSGGARGVDSLGAKYAKDNNIPVKYFIPDWEGQGKIAGFIRNQAMADYAECLIAIRIANGKSNGTDDMIRRAVKNDLIVLQYTIDWDSIELVSRRKT